MTVRDLIDCLQGQEQDTPVFIMDKDYQEVPLTDFHYISGWHQGAYTDILLLSNGE